MKGDRVEDGISRCKLLYTEWINNKVLLYRTGNTIQYLVEVEQDPIVLPRHVLSLSFVCGKPLVKD